MIRQEVDRGWRDPNLVEKFTEILPMFRTVAAPDFSRISLQALAASIERFRREAGQRSMTDTAESRAARSTLGA